MQLTLLHLLSGWGLFVVLCSREVNTERCHCNGSVNFSTSKCFHVVWPQFLTLGELVPVTGVMNTRSAGLLLL